MSAKDKQRLGIAIGLVVVVAAALYFLLFRQPRAGVEGPAGAGAPGAPAEDQDRGMAIRLPPTVQVQQQPAPPPGPVAAPPPAPAPGEPLEAAVEPAAYRADPFAPLRRPPAVRPVVAERPQILAVDEVGPPMVAATLARVMIRPRQEQRVAGVLWNDRVWAIIETPRTTAVVQPGDRVEGSTVRAISPQGLILTSEEGKPTEVRLQGRISAQPAAAVPVAAPVGRPMPPALPMGPTAY